MSQENVEIVRRMFSALDRNDWDAAFQDAHPDFRSHIHGGTQGWHPSRTRNASRGCG